MPGPVSSSWSLSPPAALSVSTPSPGSSALRPWGHTLVPSSPGTPWLGLLLFPGEQRGRNPGEGPSTGRPSPLGHQHLQKRLVPHGHHEGVLDDADELLSEVMRDRGRGPAGGGSTSTGLCSLSLPSVGNSLCFGPSGSSSGMAWPRVSPGFPTSTQVALGDRASPMRVTAAGSAIAPGQGSGTQQREPREEELLHDRDGSGACGGWCSLLRASALARHWRMGKSEGSCPAVLMHISKPRGKFQLLLVRISRFLAQQLERHSCVGLSFEEPGLFILSPSARGHRTTSWSELEGTSGDRLVQPPAKAGPPGAGCTELCPGGAGTSAEEEAPQPLGSLCQ